MLRGKWLVSLLAIRWFLGIKSSMSMPLHKDQHGISISFGTKYVISQGIAAGRDYVLMNVSFLGPYLFTTELLPLLKMTARQAPGVRIVNVSIIAPNMNIKHSLVCRNNWQDSLLRSLRGFTLPFRPAYNLALWMTSTKTLVPKMIIKATAFAMV